MKRTKITPFYILKYYVKCSLGFTIVLLLIKLLQSLSPLLLITSLTAFIDQLTFSFESGNGYGNIVVPLLFVSLSQFIGITGPSLYKLVNTRLSLILSEKLNLEIFDWIANLNYPEFENYKNQDLIFRVRESCVKNFIAGFNNILSIAEMIIKFSTVACSLFLHAKWFGLIIVALCIPMVYTSCKNGEDTYAAFTESQQVQRIARYYEKLLISREYSQERCLFSYDEEINKTWYEKNNISIHTQKKALKKNGFRLTFSSSLTVLASAILAGIMLIPLYQGTLSYGFFAGILSSTYILFQDIVYSLSWDIEQFVKTREFLKDLQSFFSLEQLENNQNKKEETNQSIVPFGGLEFKEVSFRYPETENYILKGLSFQILPGMNYAFVGKNGAGKSTITKLILGLYLDYEGQIFLNGTDIKLLSIEQRCRYFSVVFQDFSKYYLSVADNIRFGNLDYTEEHVQKVLEEVGLKDYVNCLPKGMYSDLGKILEEDTELSGGQWQRIAIARALITNRSITILDEPTAAIDPASEQELYELFSKVSANRTALFITHRLGSVQMADMIYVLDEGKILESGTHQELIQQKGMYYEMFESQKEWYK